MSGMSLEMCYQYGDWYWTGVIKVGLVGMIWMGLGMGRHVYVRYRGIGFGLIVGQGIKGKTWGDCNSVTRRMHGIEEPG